MRMDADQNYHDDLIAELADERRQRHYGKYRGVVTQIGANEDGVPGCVKVKVPAVLGETVETPWALPCVPFAGDKHGMFFLPEVDDLVWIEFEGGHLASPIWSGVLWSANHTLPTDAAEKKRVLSTKPGHRLMMDEEGDVILLEHPGGAKLKLTADGVEMEMGSCILKITSTEITLNNQMVKVTTAGVGLVNDALHVGQ
jgi:hypothetical protein